MNPVQEIQRKLSAHGLKVTPQRIAVYQALTKLGHVCVEELVSEVRKTTPSVSVATIYNTLDSMLACGLISQLSTGNNKRYYDVSTHWHSHLCDRQEQRISDFDDPVFEALIHRYIAEHPIGNFEVSDIRIQLIGEFKE